MTRVSLANATRAVWLMIFLVTIGGWITSNRVHACQDIELAAAVSTNDIFIGESIDYQIEVRNARNPSAPDLTKIKEMFVVEENGNESRNQSMTTIINGRMSQRNVFSHIYLYRLAPKVTGSLTIPVATATIDGKTYESNTVELQVNEIEDQDLVLVETECDQTRIYPTQPFTITLRVLVQPIEGEPRRDPLSPLRRRPPHLEVNWIDTPAGLSSKDKSEWLQPLLSESGIGFTLNDVSTRSGSFFASSQSAVFDLSKDRVARSTKGGGVAKEYYSYELTRTFTAEKTGNYSLGPAVVKGSFVSGTRRNEYVAKRIVAIGPTIEVEVKDVPSPRPASYCGGIGEYVWHASASPQKLRVGDPLTLTLEVERSAKSGSLELISAPDLEAIPDLAAQFELIDKKPTGRIEGAKKTFSYAIRPKVSEAQIPALTLSTFDPKTELFEELHTEPISLDVSEASRVTSGELIGSLNASASKEIKLRSEGIFQNITDPSSLRDQRVFWSRLLSYLAGIWGLAAIFVTVLSFRKHKASDPVRNRKSQAKRNALRRLREASDLHQQGKSKEGLTLIRSAILTWIADLQGKVAEGFTSSDVNAALIAAKVSEESKKSLLELLETLESAEYGAGAGIDFSGMVAQSQESIERISPFLERGGKG